MWKSAAVWLNSTTPITTQVVFEGITAQGYYGNMALDDVSFNEGACPATVNCDFEDPMLCGYTQDTSDQFDWTRQKGHTTSVGTGPTNDHTYGTATGQRVEAIRPFTYFNQTD
jgi:hypothetical protein